MATAIFLKYNNYYNRLFKREQTLADYRQYRILAPNGAYSEYTQVNFDPRDGVNTELNVNWFGDEADYLVISEDGTSISSRWFIIDQNRNLKGQKHCTLRRDVLVDYWNNIKEAPIFVEKGFCKENDSAIFNSEDITVNQIKKSQTPLYDKTGCPWVVVYYQNKMLADGDVTVTWESKPIADITLNTPINQWEYYKYTTSYSYLFPNASDVHWTNILNSSFSTGTMAQKYWNIVLTPKDTQGKNVNIALTSTVSSGTNLISTTYKKLDGEGSVPSDEVANLYMQNLAHYASVGTNPINYMSTALLFSNKQSLTVAETTAFKSLENKIVKDSTGKFYRVSFNIQDYEDYNYIGSGTWVATKLGTAANEAVTYMNSSVIPGANMRLLRDGSSSWKLEIKWQRATIKLTEVQSGSFKTIIPKALNITQDAPYNIMALPYSDTFKFGLTNPVTASKQLALDFATSITAEKGAFIYDVQLVPYAGLSSIMYKDNSNNMIGNITDTKGFQYIKTSGDTNIGVIINLSYANFQDYLDTSIAIAPTSYSKKFVDATTKVRLCSPNFASIFEYSPARANSIVTIEKEIGIIINPDGTSTKQYEYIDNYSAGPFNIYCTLKPYTPFIQIQPQFSGLYGQNFIDGRGLICSGDFSLATLSDAWTTYTNNNKNYLNAFNRQIDNMEFNNKLQRISAGVNLGVGTAAGAIGGLMSGNIGGAILGGVAGLARGLTGIGTTIAGQREALDYAKDQFGYNLGNIQAQPQTLAKVSAFNINNLGAPLVEVYDCTNEEKIAFINKIVYNGMTIMRVDLLTNFINSWTTKDTNVFTQAVTTRTYSQPYIKGKLIRLDSLNEDFHLVNEIANELNQGVFINVNNI